MTEMREPPLTINHWNVHVHASIHAHIFAFLLLHLNICACCQPSVVCASPSVLHRALIR